MMRLTRTLIRLTAFFVSFGFASTSVYAAEPNPCQELKSLTLEHVAITSVEEVSAGRSFSFAATFIGLPFVKTPASCRVKGTIAPTDDSDIRFELWMPQTEWNGKFQGIGNGGLAGSIDKLSLRNALGVGLSGILKKLSTSATAPFTKQLSLAKPLPQPSTAKHPNSAISAAAPMVAAKR